jgi:hypothetical protein
MTEYDIVRLGFGLGETTEPDARWLHGCSRTCPIVWCYGHAATLGNMKRYICVSIHFFAPQSSVQWIYLFSSVTGGVSRHQPELQRKLNSRHMTGILNFWNGTTRSIRYSCHSPSYHHETTSGLLLSIQVLPYQLGLFPLPGISQAMSADIRKQRKHAIAKADEELLAELGYKQEFRRAFKPIEVFCFLFVTRTTPISFRFWNRVQHRWSPSFYCVSHGAPLPRASLLTVRPQFCLVLFVTKWWCCCHGLGGLFRSACCRNTPTYSTASLVGRR